jgi:hypothetical protein
MGEQNLGPSHTPHASFSKKTPNHDTIRLFATLSCGIVYFRAVSFIGGGKTQPAKCRQMSDDGLQSVRQIAILMHFDAKSSRTRTST